MTTEQSTPSQWLTIAEAAEVSRFSVVTIRRAIASKRLEAQRPKEGRVWRIKRAALDAWIEGAER